MRTTLAVAVSALILCGVCSAGEATASMKKSTNIPAQQLGTALQSFANDRNLQIVFSAEDVGPLRSAGAIGELTTDEALKRLLRGTGMTYRYLDDSTVMVLPRALRTSWTGSAESFVGGPARAATGSTAAAEDSGSILEEVVVTAEKREERLQDVPLPISVLSGASLAESNQLRLQDYYSKVPGLNVQIGGATNNAILSIRGIQNGQGGSPSVGVVIDDVPYGASVDIGARGQPDIDPGDLARVEVLRGPQGTLYGASSIGGLIKFVTIDPSTNGFSGRFQAGTSSYFNGVEPGYNFRASANIPVSDTIAVRVSTFRDLDGGFINNIEAGRHGINRLTSDGGRLALLWKPSDLLSLKVSAMVQDSRRDGADIAVVAPGFGDLDERSIPNTNKYDEKTQAYSATLTAKLGRAELTSLTGYNVDHMSVVGDTTRVATGYWDYLANTYLSTMGPGSVALITSNTHRISEELRLTVPLTDHIRWLLGGFYSDETNRAITTQTGADPNTGTPTPGYFVAVNNRLEYREYAPFTTVTYDITSRFDLQVGGRWGENRQSYSALRTGPVAPQFFCQPTAVPCPALNITDFPFKGSSFTYLVTPEYKISPDFMVYSRLASGYRPGGPNVACYGAIPCAYDAEKTKNYDLGLKGNFFNHIVSIDMALYHISYSNIQLGLFDSASGAGYTENLGTAKSQGIEFSVATRPFKGLSLSAWVAWDDAEFTQSLPAQGVVAGARLPFSARFSGNFSADEEFTLADALSAFFGGQVSYVGSREGAGPPYPAYAQTDLKAGLRHGTWTVMAFVNNVTDKRGILTGGTKYQYTFPDLESYTYIQPRNVGLNLTKTF